MLIKHNAVVAGWLGEKGYPLFSSLHHYGPKVDRIFWIDIPISTKTIDFVFHIVVNTLIPRI